MHVLRLAATALCAIAFALSHPVTAKQPIDDALARLDRYLIAYEPRLSELIADELLIQEIHNTASRGLSRDALRPGGSRRRRRLVSEVAFLGLPNDAGWLGFRDVKSVNNRALSQRKQSLSTALQASQYDAARSLLAASAAQNLGLPRTTNLPNLPLEFLHRRNRERLVMLLDGEERIRGVTTARLVFNERLKPTLIRDPQGADMPSVVRAWVDPAGRLLRAEVLTFTTGDPQNAESSIRVEFKEHKALGLLVPSEMQETFPVALREQPAKGVGVATYSNFRRFQTSARIIPPEGD
jgi:hypothetical protein